MHHIQVAGRYALILLLMAVLLLPSVLPGLVSAAQVSNRSIVLSSASAGASGVTYTVNFTASEAAAAVVLDFCANSPLFGQECTSANGFSVAEADSNTANFQVVSTSSTRVVVSGSVAAESQVSFTLRGVTNPSTPGVLYARVATYQDVTDATSSPVGALGEGVVDHGSIAMAITPTIGVSGTVLETMTFCVSASPIARNCSTVESPNLELGRQMANGVVALVPGEISEGIMYTQLSTNALNGGVVRLKSSAIDCGGLMRAGSPNACDILPAGDKGISVESGEARFGVKTAPATDTLGAQATGILQPAAGSLYNNSEFAFNFVEGNTSGVTSTYGDPFLDTAGKPANNKNMQLTFGVMITDDTPAGDYSAQLSVIATGRF